MNQMEMKTEHLLAAETFSYSYANYADHLGVNVRFERLMPEYVKTLETAEEEEWNTVRLAKALELETEQAQRLLRKYQLAKEIVFAPDAAEAFRIGVKQSIEYALEQGISTTQDVDKLVEQICYRAADLAILLDRESKKLSDYSEQLRRRTNRNRI
jgi:hypothetical protein